jgi:hypothetical protein
MPRHLRVRLLSAFLAAAISSSSALAQKPDLARAGTLTCDIAAGIGLIIAAKKNLTCMFVPAQPGPREVYLGSVGKFGPDPAKIVAGEMVWAVYASSNRHFGMLAGHYGPVAASKLGANMLVGGSDRAVSLQPVSMQDQTDIVNIAAGVADFDLRPAR